MSQIGGVIEPSVMIRCSDCELEGVPPTALFAVQGGQVVVKGTHHGRVHVTVIPVITLVDMGRKDLADRVIEEFKKFDKGRRLI